MKSVIRNTFNAARRLALRFQMRSLEAHIAGCDECLECVEDRITRLRIIFARAEARRELARVRSEYNALLPVGRRMTWGSA